MADGKIEGEDAEAELRASMIPAAISVLIMATRPVEPLRASSTAS